MSDYPFGLEPPPTYADGSSGEWVTWLDNVLSTVRLALYRAGSYFQFYGDGDPASHTYAEGTWHSVSGGVGAINYTGGDGVVVVRGDYGFDAAGGGCTAWDAECRITKDGSVVATFDGTSAMYVEQSDGVSHDWDMEMKVTGGGCNIAFYGYQVVVEER